MTMPLRVLIIEDFEPDAALVIYELRRGNRALDVQVVATIADTRAALTSPGAPWDVVLCDWSLPGFLALDVLPIVNELAVDTPVIIVSGAISEELAVSVMRAGARDFVLKDRLARLAPAVEREVREAEA
ncbi:MAG: response regulator transcription factor, partial [Myxococcales bacterium]|nr:response regulator transcription factor [Myxococcales bacterium]